MPKGYAKSGKAPNRKQPIPKGRKIGPPQNDLIKKIPKVKPANMDLAKDIPADSGTMTLNDYQHYAKEFIKFPDKFSITYPALGLCEEAGEVAGKVCKAIRDHKTLQFAELPMLVRDELGDCLWQLSVLAYNLGITLEEVAEANLAKLKDRAARGKIEGSGDAR